MHTPEYELYFYTFSEYDRYTIIIFLHVLYNIKYKTKY